MRKILFLAAAISLLSACVAVTDEPADPNTWLEDTHGEKALSWVQAENERTLARLTGDKRHDTFRREALAIF
ncbi:MAG: S9 family peptidase, partial [Alphaproteobacteria bacterium]